MITRRNPSSLITWRFSASQRPSFSRKKHPVIRDDGLRRQNRGNTAWIEPLCSLFVPFPTLFRPPYRLPWESSHADDSPSDTSEIFRRMSLVNVYWYYDADLWYASNDGYRSQSFVARVREPEKHASFVIIFKINEEEQQQKRTELFLNP